MSKCLGCYEIYKCASLGRPKAAYELSSSFVKARAPQEDNDSSNPPDFFFTKTFFLEVLVEKHYAVNASY